MTDITVENIEADHDIVTGDEAPKTFSERLIERGDGDFVEPVEAPPDPPALERQPIAFQTNQGEVNFEAAPKRRGRPKGTAEPKGEPKRRGRPPAIVEPIEEAPPAPPIDVNALLEPIFRAYMATNEMRKRDARQQRYRDLFQGMAG